MPRPMDEDKWRLWAEWLRRFEQRSLTGAKRSQEEGLAHLWPGGTRSVASGQAQTVGTNCGR